MKFAVVYSPNPKAAGKKKGAQELTFYTEDKDAVRALVKRGAEQGFIVTVREVRDGP
jgi:hypothetical protein